MSCAACDIVLVGVGGQGVLTIGELLVRAALAAEIAVTFAPTKGMAQRGGFVKAELRLGRAGAGPRIGDRGADLVLATERSEAVRGIRFAKPGGAFVLYDEVWTPTGVMVGKAKYPEREAVIRAIRAAGVDPMVIVPSALAPIDGRPPAANLVVLGAACATPALAGLLEAERVEKVVAARWPKAAGANVAAFRLGYGLAGAG